MNQVTMTLLALLFSINGLAATETISQVTKTVNLTVDSSNSSCVVNSFPGYIDMVTIMETITLKRTPTLETVFPHSTLYVQSYVETFTGGNGNPFGDSLESPETSSSFDNRSRQPCSLYKEVVAQSQAGQAVATMTIELTMNRWLNPQGCNRQLVEKVAIGFSNGLALYSSERRNLSIATPEHCE